MQISSSIENNRTFFQKKLRPDISFDVVDRNLMIGGRDACLYCIDGFTKDDTLLKVLQAMSSIETAQMPDNANDFAALYLAYGEIGLETDSDALIIQLLSGVPFLLIDGYAQALTIDCRTYPARGVSEPEKDKVLRGSRDGFVETLVFQYGSDPAAHPRSEAADGNHEYWGKFAHRYRHLLHGKPGGHRTFKPHPHPDSKSACRCPLDEPGKPCRMYLSRTNGSIRSQNFVFQSVRIPPLPRFWKEISSFWWTNSPSAMILPSSIFDIIEEADDYYFPPLTGTYLRLSRTVIFFLTLFLTPLWLLFMQNPGWIPEWLAFIRVTDEIHVALIYQLLILEFAIDGLAARGSQHPQHADDTAQCHRRYRAWRILGQIRLVQQRDDASIWAFVTIANYSMTSFELGYALKFMRVLLLILTFFLNLWGFIAGTLIAVGCLVFNRTIAGKSYIYPLIPFHWSELKKRLLRNRLPHEEKNG